jgi:hypothetical protein
MILYWTDWVLMPILGFILYFVFKKIRDGRYKGEVIARYFLPALVFRLIGAILTAIMYQYYYGFGDTFYYYYGASDIFAMWGKDWATAIEMCFVDYSDLSQKALQGIEIHRLFREPSTGLVMRIGGFISPLAFGSFIGISFYMTAFAFIGCWMLYKVFYDLYPHLHKQLAWAILFVPSICFWGTGLMKDSLTMGGLGFMVYGGYYLFIKRKKIIRSTFFLLLGGYLMAFIKVYIVLALAPAMVVWVFMMYKEKIRIIFLRKLATPIFLTLGLVGGLLALQRIGDAFAEYSFENIMSQAQKTQWWLTVSSERDGGMGYTLGNFSPTPTGLLAVFPAAVNVSLFRPYIWEARKPIVLPSATEAVFTLFFTLFVFWKVGFWKTIKAIFADPVILFCLIFAVIFAFAVGFSTLNFGSLARYKIPCLPFYFTAMIILLYEYSDYGNPKIENKKTKS